MPFGRHVASCLELFFDTFQDLAKKAELYESVAHTVWIGSRAGPKTINNHKKKQSKKRYESEAGTVHDLLLNFCLFRTVFGTLLGATMR